jgi:hypothetical protein
MHLATTAHRDSAKFGCCDHPPSRRRFAGFHCSIPSLD